MSLLDKTRDAIHDAGIAADPGRPQQDLWVLARSRIRLALIEREVPRRRRPREESDPSISTKRVRKGADVYRGRILQNQPAEPRDVVNQLRPRERRRRYLHTDRGTRPEQQCRND